MQQVTGFTLSYLGEIEPYKRLSEKQFNSMNGVDYSKQESEEVRKLKREIADLKEENEFLKKATAYFSKDKW